MQKIVTAVESAVSAAQASLQTTKAKAAGETKRAPRRPKRKAFLPSMLEGRKIAVTQGAEDEGQLRTVIDRTVDFVREKKHTTVEEISRELAIETHQVEQLADILEESGLVTIKYSLLNPGKTEIFSKEASAGRIEEGTGSAKLASEADMEILEAEKGFLRAEEEVLRRLSRAEGALTVMEDKESFGEEETKKVMIEVDAAERVLGEFENKIRTLQGRLADLRNKAEDVRERVTGGRQGGPGFLGRLGKVIGRRLS